MGIKITGGVRKFTEDEKNILSHPGRGFFRFILH